MSKVNWNFIRELEGFETTGYVPDAGASSSGVTIGTGFDLGARQESDLDGLDDDLKEALKPFLGFKGAEHRR
jgi:type VI secretion system secreted protein VgrG